MEKNFAVMLKEIAPKTFEDFRVNYLAKNYEFWNKSNAEGDMLWFCERDYRSQMGYYLGWFEEKHPFYLSAPTRANVKTIQFLIFHAFCELEKKHFANSPV